MPGHSPVGHQPEEDAGHHCVHHEDEAVHEGAGIEPGGGGGGPVFPHVLLELVGLQLLR